MIAKISLAILGLMLLAGPQTPAINSAYHQGQVIAQAFGGFLLILALFPFGKSKNQRPDDEITEGDVL
jgi:hypothetical protein